MSRSDLTNNVHHLSTNRIRGDSRLRREVRENMKKSNSGTLVFSSIIIILMILWIVVI